jgi:hypothetical protein
VLWFYRDARVPLSTSRAAGGQPVGAAPMLVAVGGPHVTGEMVHSYGTHADVAERILARAAQLSAGVIVIGPDTGDLPLAASVAARIAARAPTHNAPGLWTTA